MSGHYRAYKHHNFRKESLELIGHANEIIETHAAVGLDMTLRQIHYKLTNRPDYANTTANYNKLGNLLSKARMAGLVSWTAMVDRERSFQRELYFEAPEHVFRNLDASYKRDKWQDQDWYPVVGVEKKALVGVISQMCYEAEVPFIAFKGYSSQSTTWRLGQRMAGALKKGQRPILFYLGDHDSSGLDMDRDLAERLSLFAGTQIMVQRLSLTMSQIEEYAPPENPAKDTDSRFDQYRDMMIDRHGYGEEDDIPSWELDALDPLIIQGLIRDAVARIRDEDRWAASMDKEVEDKLYIKELVDQLGLHIEDEDEDDEED